MRRCWLLLLTLLVGCSRSAETEPLWIGHLVSTSGPHRERGEEAIQAIDLVIQQLKTEKKTFFGREVWVRHVEATDRATARAEMVRLLAVNRVLAVIVGPGLEDPAEVVATARSQGSAVIVTQRDLQREGRALARFALMRTNATRLTHHWPLAQAASSPVANAFLQIWQSGERTIDESNSQPGIPALGIGPTVTLRLDQQEFSVEPIPPVEQLSTLAQDWRERYRKQFEESPDASAFYTYDALNLLLDRLEQLERPTRAALAEAVQQLSEFEGLLGTVRQREGRWSWPLFLVERQDTQRRLIETIPADQP